MPTLQHKGTAKIDDGTSKTATPSLDTTGQPVAAGLEVDSRLKRIHQWPGHRIRRTIYATGGVFPPVAGDRSSKSAPTLHHSSASVDQAMDVATFAGNLVVAQYKNSSSRGRGPKRVGPFLYRYSDPRLRAVSTDDTGYSGITVNAAGIFISRIRFTRDRRTQDRVLVSSPVPSRLLV